MNLLIVESPGKIKKIQGFLGEGWQVMASVGHVRDLPRDDIGVNETSYRPRYLPTERGKGVIAKLAKAVQDAQAVYLATDPTGRGKQSRGIWPTPCGSKTLSVSPTPKLQNRRSKRLWLARVAWTCILWPPRKVVVFWIGWWATRSPAPFHAPWAAKSLRGASRVRLCASSWIVSAKSGLLRSRRITESISFLTRSKT